MGYAKYVLDGESEPRGYAVDTTCQADGCEEQIDKGIDNLCYRCLGYFCEAHRTVAFDANDAPLEFECFAGKSSQICSKCCSEVE